MKIGILAFVMAAALFSWAQTPAPPAIRGPQQTPTLSAEEAPQTAPQTQQVLPSYERQRVYSVELAGRPDLAAGKYSGLVTQKAGQPFSRQKVDESIAALKHTGKFQDVQLQVLPGAEGVRVLLVLHPAIYYGIFEFPGAERFSYSRLLQLTNYPPGGPYTAFEVQQDQEALATFFRRSGFFLSEVTPRLQIDSAQGIVNVIFAVRLGRRAKFGDVTIEGPPQQEAGQLELLLRSLRARLHSSAIRPGKTYNLKTIENATQYLLGRLNKQSHLAAQVRLIGAKYNRDTNRADISFHVQPGPTVRVQLEGAHLWPWTRREQLPIYQQAGVNAEIIEEGRQNLVSYFQSKGYFDAQVSAQVQQESAREMVLYKITKDKRHKVAGVKIAGYQQLPDSELMPLITVQKARPFLHGKYSDHLVRTSTANLRSVYQAAGFSSVKITPQVAKHHGNLEVTFRVDEGPRDIVEALRIEGNSTLATAQLAPRGLKLSPGQPYSANLVGKDRTQIITTYLQLGYLMATFRETSQSLPDQPHRIEVVYHIDEGPQVHTAAIITLGRKNTRQRLIDRDTAVLQPGKPLTQKDLLSSESELYAQRGVFDWAEVDPRRQITTQTEEDVLVKVHEAQPNRLIYGVGFEVINRGGSIPSGTVALPNLPPTGLPKNFQTSETTFWGPRGSIEYTRNNLRGKAESLTLTAFAGRLDQRGGATYSDPTFNWGKWGQSVTTSGEHNSENPVFTSRLALGSYQLQRPLDAKRTQNLFLRYRFSETGLTRLLIPALVSPENLHVRLSTLSVSYIRDTRDNALDAHRGAYDTAEFNVNPSALGSSVNFAKFAGQAAYYKKIPANIIWANSLRLSLAKPFSGSFVPLSEEFFSGGGSTLRGFPLDGAGPQQTIPACGTPGVSSTCSLITVPVGGNELLIINSEFRYPLDAIIKNLGFATFYDGGNVFSTIGFHGQYTNSLGGGFRYKTPVGPVRIDIGHNLNGAPGIKSTQVFVTVGQAF
jgi:outer membrane protein assembly complex protein YaeT